MRRTVAHAGPAARRNGLVRAARGIAPAQDRRGVHADVPALIGQRPPGVALRLRLAPNLTAPGVHAAPRRRLLAGRSAAGRRGEAPQEVVLVAAGHGGAREDGDRQVGERLQAGGEPR